MARVPIGTLDWGDDLNADLDNIEAIGVNAQVDATSALAAAATADGKAVAAQTDATSALANAATAQTVADDALAAAATADGKAVTAQADATSALAAAATADGKAVSAQADVDTLALSVSAKVRTVPVGTTGWETEPDGTLWVEYTP